MEIMGRPESRISHFSTYKAITDPAEKEIITEGADRTIAFPVLALLFRLQN